MSSSDSNFSELLNHRKRLRLEDNELDREGYSSKLPKLDTEEDTISSEDDDEVEATNHSSNEQPSSKQTIGERLLRKAGFNSAGKGLGAQEQGMLHPLQHSSHIGRRGLGFDTSSSTKEVSSALINSIAAEAEIKSVEEKPLWLECDPKTRAEFCKKFSSQQEDEWILLGKPKQTIDDETKYCLAELVSGILEAKTVFDSVERRVLDDARARANPYETIKSGFFQNRFKNT